jgi:tetratricopeptide (TPR) repeat protein
MNWLCANYWTYNSDKRRELCGLNTITYSAEPQNWWQGQYKESIRYYIRALAMNPKADNAWQYLRISLRYMCFTLQLVQKFAVHQNSLHLYAQIRTPDFSIWNPVHCMLALFIWSEVICKLFCSCASRSDLIDACDKQDLELLQKEYPLWFITMHACATASFCTQICGWMGCRLHILPH